MPTRSSWPSRERAPNSHLNSYATLRCMPEVPQMSRDFDPTGTSALGAGYSKHSREEGWFADQHKKIKLKMLGAMDSTP